MAHAPHRALVLSELGTLAKVAKAGKIASAETPPELPNDPVAKSIVLAGRRANGEDRS
jgi:hypothetical protein